MLLFGLYQLIVDWLERLLALDRPSVAQVIVVEHGESIHVELSGLYLLWALLLVHDLWFAG